MKHEIVITFKTKYGISTQSLKESVQSLVVASHLFGYAPEVTIGRDPELDSILDLEAAVDGQQKLIKMFCSMNSWEIQKYLEPHRREQLERGLNNDNWELVLNVQPVVK
jgi:hypothetical protein